MRERSVIDIFCGAGGLSHGFVLERFTVVAGLDSDASCKYAYEHNNNAQFIQKKIEDVRPEDLTALYPEGHVRVLVGCAPCQPFSPYTKKKPKGEKWKLLTHFSDLIDRVRPDIVSMENVPDLVSFECGTVYEDFVRRLRTHYHVTSYFINCPAYGIPQSRRRLVLFASTFGKILPVASTYTPTQYRTVRETIGHLPAIESGQVSPTDPLHRASGLSDLNMRRIQQSRPGGTWRDWEPDLVASCHKRKSGESYESVYGRMSWDDPAPTMTTLCFGYGNGRFGHPEQNRAISLREAALLQTFPPTYEFVKPGDPVMFKVVGRHIGNAVPVELARVIARSIDRHLEAHDA